MNKVVTRTSIAAALLAGLTLTVRLVGQGLPQSGHASYYSVRDLGTLGGTFSWAYNLNEKGSVTGVATLPGDNAQHAFLWRSGEMTDLGTLGENDSFPVYRHNDRDEVVGGSGVGIDAVPFFWKDGVISSLPTFGGNHGQGASINNRGQIVGGATTATSTACGPFQPALWYKGQIAQLPLFPGDAIGTAYWINDEGQAVGWSMAPDCATFHTLMWDNGQAIDLGSLGGTITNATGINNKGQVAGASFVAGSTFYHAFLWEKVKGMRDLGTLPGDVQTVALGINNQAQITGSSCDATGNCRGFLWQNGTLTDLNTRIASDSPWYILEADYMNARGEIAGAGFDSNTGEIHAILLVPTDCAAVDTCAASLGSGHGAGRSFTFPDRVRKLLQEHRDRRLQASQHRITK